MKSIIPITIFLLLAMPIFAQDKAFGIHAIPDSTFALMQGKSWKKGCSISRYDLRYLTLLHIDENGETHQGELICHKDIANDLLEIFHELYKHRYPIHSIKLIDEYEGSDEASMRSNNTSCFNYRRTSRGGISKHSKGMAVDINPLWNPCVRITATKDTIVEPANAKKYVKRQQANPNTAKSKLISHHDLCHKLFTNHGFKWGGSWRSMKDYQHFEK